MSAFRKWSDRNEEKGNGFRFEPTDGGGVGKTITSKERQVGNYIDDELRLQREAENVDGPSTIGSLNKYGFDQADSVWDSSKQCPTILAHLQGQIGHQVNILEEEETDDG